MERGYRRLAAVLVCAAWAAATGALEPAPQRPDGDFLGGGSERLLAEATRQAHLHFNGDACLAGIEVDAFRAGPRAQGPREDAFRFIFRSPTLFRMRAELRVCLAHGPGAPPPCDGEWQLHQAKGEAQPARCLAGRLADSAKALIAAQGHGLPPPSAQGLRLALLQVPKSGSPLARQAKLRGRTIWLVESRDECHAVDASSVEHLLKAPCGQWRR